MSTFREHKTIADRAAGDRRRHRQKIEKAIKESIKDVLPMPGFPIINIPKPPA